MTNDSQSDGSDINGLNDGNGSDFKDESQTLWVGNKSLALITLNRDLEILCANSYNRNVMRFA